MLFSCNAYIPMKSYQILSDHYHDKSWSYCAFMSFLECNVHFQSQDFTDKSWYIMINRDKSWYIMILSDIVWYCLILSDIIWYIMIYHDDSMLKSISHYFCPIKHIVAFAFFQETIMDRWIIKYLVMNLPLSLTCLFFLTPDYRS